MLVLKFFFKRKYFYGNFLRKPAVWSREMAQSLSMDEQAGEPELDPQGPTEKTWWHELINIPLGKRRQEEPWGLLLAS